MEQGWWSRNGRYGRKAAGRLEVADSGMAAYEAKSVENCRPLVWIRRSGVLLGLAFMVTAV